MGKRTSLIVGTVFLSGTILASAALAASPEEVKYMWTVTAKCTQKAKTVTQTHCGKRGEAIGAAKGQLRNERGCGQIDVVSVEKGERCD